MHKSIIFLLGFLVFLLPFGPSSMNISNAMAITEAEYYTDQYMGYANDMVNEYEDESSYANNGYGSEQDRTYGNNNGNNNYDSERQSYKSDYKSYENNDYKSKDRDSSNSVSISKIKCENVNNNFNNVVIENLNIGNSGNGGSASDDGSNGDQSANAYRNNGEGYHNDGYQKDKDITCIITNNNTIITSDGSNTTEPPTACELCFTNATVVDAIEATLELPGGIPLEGVFLEDIGAEVLTIKDLCEYIEDQDFVSDFAFNFILSELVDDTAGISQESIEAIEDCLILAGVIENT